MFTQCLGLYRVYAHETVLYFQHDFIFPSSKLHKLHFHHIVLIVRFIVALLVSFPKKVDRKNAINIQITRQDLVDWRRWCTTVSFTVRERSFSWTSSTSHNVCHHLSPWFSERHCSAKAGAALLLYLASLFYWCFVATTETSRFVASRSPKSPVDKTRKIIGASLTWTKQKQKKGPNADHNEPCLIWIQLKSLAERWDGKNAGCFSQFCIMQQHDRFRSIVHENGRRKRVKRIVKTKRFNFMITDNKAKLYRARLMYRGPAASMIRSWMDRTHVVWGCLLPYASRVRWLVLLTGEAEGKSVDG